MFLTFDSSSFERRRNYMSARGARSDRESFVLRETRQPLVKLQTKCCKNGKNG
jgi:hypothetical protein